jgi:hypothetical protein
VTEQKDGGRLVPDAFVEKTYTLAAIQRAGEELLRATDAYGDIWSSFRTLPRKPLTRRQRIRARWWNYRERITTAWDALRGRHECGY